MGDDLGEEWWLESNDNVDSVEQDNVNAGKSKKSVAGETLKRKVETSTADSDSSNNKKSRKKRRTKQKISEYLSKNTPRPSTETEVMTKMEMFFKEKLSPIELEEVQLNESHFLQPNSSSLPLAAYLEMALPHWGRDIEAKRPKNTKTCLLLLVTSSGKRAVDLNREAASFKGKQCLSAKLFAKHMKIQEQITSLAKNRTQFAVGTPNRIAALLQQDALNLTGTRYVILDWNWRDVKYRRMCDIPELRADLFGLFERYVIPRVRSDEARLKIGIF